MQKIELAVLTLAATVAFAACAPAGAGPSEELAAKTGQFEAMLNGGDIGGLVALYTEDALVMPPNAESARGHDYVRDIFGGMIDAGLKGRLENIEATVAADVGYKIGRYQILGPGDMVLDRGKFLEIWRQVGGEWLIASDIWNSDMPAGMGGTVLLATHQVRDADRWLAAWRGPNSRHQMFAENGASFTRTFRSLQNPNVTALMIGVSDMEALDAMLSSPEGAQAKAEDGVIDATLQIFTEAQ